MGLVEASMPTLTGIPFRRGRGSRRFAVDLTGNRVQCGREPARSSLHQHPAWCKVVPLAVPTYRSETRVPARGAQ